MCWLDSNRPTNIDWRLWCVRGSLILTLTEDCDVYECVLDRWVFNLEVYLLIAFKSDRETPKINVVFGMHVNMHVWLGWMCWLIILSVKYFSVCTCLTVDSKQHQLSSQAQWILLYHSPHQIFRWFCKGRSIRQWYDLF